MSGRAPHLYVLTLYGPFGHTFTFRESQDAVQETGDSRMTLRDSVEARRDLGLAEGGRNAPLARRDHERPRAALHELQHGADNALPGRELGTNLEPQRLGGAGKACGVAGQCAGSCIRIPYSVLGRPRSLSLSRTNPSASVRFRNTRFSRGMEVRI